MTDLSHYRVGPTKTCHGLDAVIYAIYPGQDFPIHGAMRGRDGQWYTYEGNPGGAFLPNATPTTVTRWLPPDGSLAVSDTEREGWTRVEVPVQPVRGSVTLLGYKDYHRWGFTQNPENRDTHRLTLPTEGGDLVCGEYRDGAANAIKVERIK